MNLNLYTNRNQKMEIGFYFNQKKKIILLKILMKRKYFLQKVQVEDRLLKPQNMIKKFELEK